MKKRFYRLMAICMMLIITVTIAPARTPAAAKAVKKVIISKKSVNLQTGKTIQLKATVTPSNAVKKTVKWKTSKPKVAVVNSKGKVKAKEAGTAIITAYTANGKKGICKIKVTAKKISTIALNKTDVLLGEDGEYTLIATVNGDNSPDLTWSSSDEQVVCVDDEGNLYAVEEGDAVITVTNRDGTKAICYVTVFFDEENIEDEDIDTEDIYNEDIYNEDIEDEDIDDEDLDNEDIDIEDDYNQADLTTLSFQKNGHSIEG